jgi:hypothetical protein
VNDKDPFEGVEVKQVPGGFKMFVPGASEQPCSLEAALLWGILQELRHPRVIIQREFTEKL